MKSTNLIKIISFKWFLVYMLLFSGTNDLLSQTSILESSGDVLFVALPTVTFGTTLLKKDKKGSNQFIKSLVVTVAVTGGLKLLIDKERPNMENNNSFPSGHTSVTFQSASFIQRRYGWNYGAPAYLLAGFTGYTRVTVEKHDIIDVIAGAVIGIGSTYLFTTPYQQEHMELSFGKVNEAYMLGFRFTF